MLARAPRELLLAELLERVPQEAYCGNIKCSCAAVVDRQQRRIRELIEDYRGSTFSAG